MHQKQVTCKRPDNCHRIMVHLNNNPLPMVLQWRKLNSHLDKELANGRPWDWHNNSFHHKSRLWSPRPFERSCLSSDIKVKDMTRKLARIVKVARRSISWSTLNFFKIYYKRKFKEFAIHNVKNQTSPKKLLTCRKVRDSFRKRPLSRRDNIRLHQRYAILSTSAPTKSEGTFPKEVSLSVPDEKTFLRNQTRQEEKTGKTLLLQSAPQHQKTKDVV